MSERKVLLFILSVIFYCLYSVHMWFMTKGVNEEKLENIKANAVNKPVVKTNNTRPKNVIKPKVIPLFIKDACSALEVFTKKPVIDKRKIVKAETMDTENNTLTVIGITVFLVILLLNALLDVLKVKEEERAKRKLNPDGDRRQSLAEFANKKVLRRESSKFGNQLFQIAESVDTPDEEQVSKKDTRPYIRGESINSYLSEKKQKTHLDNTAPASINETSEPKLVKRQSVSKLIGARPAPMVRRSSFPALPFNPDIQALMLNKRQSSFDSDDEGEGRGRRVRIIRRF